MLIIGCIITGFFGENREESSIIHFVALANQQISQAKLEQGDAKLEGDTNLAFAYEGAEALKADFCLPMQGMRRAKPCPLFRHTCGAHEPERCMVSLWVDDKWMKLLKGRQKAFCSLASCILSMKQKCNKCMPKRYEIVKIRRHAPQHCFRELSTSVNMC